MIFPTGSHRLGFFVAALFVLLTLGGATVILVRLKDKPNGVDTPRPVAQDTPKPERGTPDPKPERRPKDSKPTTAPTTPPPIEDLPQAGENPKPQPSDEPAKLPSVVPSKPLVPAERPAVPAPKPAPKIEQPKLPPRVEPVQPPPIKPVQPPVKPAIDPAVAALKKDLTAKDPKIRIAALNKARELGEEANSAAGPICNCLLDPNPKVVSAALEAVERVRPDLYKPLSTLLLDEEYANRLAAVKKLGQLGSQAVDAKPVLFSLLKTTATLYGSDLQGGSPELRSRDYRDLPLRPYIDALRSIDAEDAETIKLLKQLARIHLEGERVAYRVEHTLESATGHHAIALLHNWAGEHGDRRGDLIPLLKIALNSQSVDAILVALKISGEYGDLSKNLVPKIKELKLHPEASIRDAAKKSIDELEGR